MRLLLAILVAGCGSSHGVALDLTIKPNCVNDNGAVDKLVMTVNLSPPAQNDSITLTGATLFADIGRSNRVVLVLPDATTHADVSVNAYGAQSQIVGFGEIGLAIDGPRIYTETLDLGNAVCPVAGGGSDGGTGGDGGGVVSPIDFVGSSNFPPTLGGTSVTLNVPGGVMEGDLLLASVIVYSTAVTALAPDMSWTTHDSVPPMSFTMANFYKVAGPAEPASYTFMLTGSAGAGAVLGVYRGVDPAHPINNSAAASVFSSSSAGVQSWVLPSVNVNVSKTTLVVLLAHRYGAATAPMWMPPSAMTKREDLGAMAIFDERVVGPALIAPGTASLVDDQQYTTFDVVALQPM